MNQKIAEIQGILGVTQDGIFGPKSKAALEALISVPSGNLVDERSELNIATLHPRVQPLARRLIQQAAENGMIFKVTSGSRTYEEQAELRKRWEEGKGGKAARPGYSNHNFGLAFDVTEFKSLLPGALPIWESPNYKRMGNLGQGLGLFWGGKWMGDDEDQPHFELHPPQMANWSEGAIVSELRRRHDNNIDPFV